jgi:hypothetical protein
VNRVRTYQPPFHRRSLATLTLTVSLAGSAPAPPSLSSRSTIPYPVKARLHPFGIIPDELAKQRTPAWRLVLRVIPRSVFDHKNSSLAQRPSPGRVGEEQPISAIFKQSSGTVHAPCSLTDRFLSLPSNADDSDATTLRSLFRSVFRQVRISSPGRLNTADSAAVPPPPFAHNLVPQPFRKTLILRIMFRGHNKRTYPIKHPFSREKDMLRMSYTLFLYSLPLVPNFLRSAR